VNPGERPDLIGPEWEGVPMTEREVKRGLEKAHEDMLVVLEGAIASLLEADKRVRESYWGDGVVPEVVTRVFRRALEEKVDRVPKRVACPFKLEFKRASGQVLLGGRVLKADRDTARSLVREVAGFSPDLVLEMVRALEKTASELLQAIEDAQRVALRVGRRCLESPAMKEISRRAALRRMRKM
jgi:hypothetical protein